MNVLTPDTLKNILNAEVTSALLVFLLVLSVVGGLIIRTIAASNIKRNEADGRRDESAAAITTGLLKFSSEALGKLTLALDATNATMREISASNLASFKATPGDVARELMPTLRIINEDVAQVDKLIIDRAERSYKMAMDNQAATKSVNDAVALIPQAILVGFPAMIAAQFAPATDLLQRVQLATERHNADLSDLIDRNTRELSDLVTSTNAKILAAITMNAPDTVKFTQHDIEGIRAMVALSVALPTPNGVQIDAIAVGVEVRANG